MSSRRHQPTRCRVCGVHNSEQPVSKRGYCFEHGRERLIANNEQLEAKSGWFYDHWEARSIMWARRLLTTRQARLDTADGKG